MPMNQKNNAILISFYWIFAELVKFTLVTDMSLTTWLQQSLDSKFLKSKSEDLSTTDGKHSTGSWN